MNVVIISIGIFVLMLILGFVYLVVRVGFLISIGIVAGLIIILGFAYFFLLDDRCRELHKNGFDYEMTEGRSPTWDTAMFFFRSSEGKKVEGPWISGDRLKVRCRDVDGDGVAEFIIQSRVWETYKTILKVDFEAGRDHVHYTEGLRVNYPQEGFYDD